jgi:hypothetical protein
LFHQSQQDYLASFQERGCVEEKMLWVWLRPKFSPRFSQQISLHVVGRVWDRWMIWANSFPTGSEGLLNINWEFDQRFTLSRSVQFTVFLLRISLLALFIVGFFLPSPNATSTYEAHLKVILGSRDHTPALLPSFAGKEPGAAGSVWDLLIRG